MAGPAKRAPRKAKRSSGVAPGMSNDVLASRSPWGRRDGKDDREKLLATAQRRVSRRAPALAGQRETSPGDRVLGAGVNRSHGNLVQPGKSARFGQKYKLGVTPDGRVVHLYGNGRGKNRVVLDRKSKNPPRSPRTAAKTAFSQRQADTRKKRRAGAGRH